MAECAVSETPHQAAARGVALISPFPEPPMKRQTISRRSFLRTAAAGGAAIALGRLSAKSYAQIVGANSDIRIAVVGCNDCGRSHIRQFTTLGGVRLVALCDADSAIVQRGADMVAQAKPAWPAAQKFADVRKLLESKEIDAISTATPNHWHALITVWACQAGKDIYVEKPICHSVWEVQQAVAAARKYDRIVQAGTQWRSMPQVFDAMEFAKAGKLGKILVSRGLCYKPRPSIGKTEGPQPLPTTVDYDLWCGPAAKADLRRKNLHYDWHWVWETGNGDIGNQGAHQMDLARWALDEPAVAPSVISLGGRFGYVDDGETPNTLMTVHDYGKALLIFEVRGLPTKSGAGTQMDSYKGADIGNIIECEHGYVSISQRQCAAFDADGKQLQVFNGAGVTRDRNHQDNFLKAVRSRKRADLQGEIAEGAASSYLCHLSNISHRTGKEASPDAIKAAFNSGPAAETLARFTAHLDANGIKLDTAKAQLGMPLKVDPATLKITGNEAASKLLTRAYRAPFVVPESV
jgi:predicted dehydrogenase